MTTASRVWRDMWARCTQPQKSNYKYYGGAGITIDPAWKDFKTFVADMGRPARGMTIERKDKTKGYSKDNCKWATRAEQNRNRNTSNKSGVVGVTWEAKGFWRARGAKAGCRQETFYTGMDLFEACCRRKSWENRNF